jgi:hypothetical protein
MLKAATTEAIVLILVQFHPPPARPNYFPKIILISPPIYSLVLEVGIFWIIHIKFCLNLSLPCMIQAKIIVVLGFNTPYNSKRHKRNMGQGQEANPSPLMLST